MRTGREEPIGFVIHIFMEIIQENSLCGYLYLKLAKTSKKIKVGRRMTKRHIAL
jgi:hypothetical protein